MAIAFECMLYDSHGITMRVCVSAGLFSNYTVGIVTNYRPPVLYDILSEFNNTLTSPSKGSEVCTAASLDANY